VNAISPQSNSRGVVSTVVDVSHTSLVVDIVACLLLLLLLLVMVVADSIVPNRILCAMKSQRQR
jgi:hypothetical protein